MGIPMVLMGAPGVGPGGGQTLDQYLTTLGGWTLDLKFNEPSGNITNYGSDGGTGTAANLTYGQAGQEGAASAVSYNGTTSIVTFLNAAVPATKALTTQRWMFLVNLVNAGESNVGALFTWGVTVFRLVFGSADQLNFRIDTDGTDAQALTAAGSFTLFNTWTLVFADYDDADAMGLGRKCRLWYATAATAATAATLGADVAGTGTVVTPVGNLIVGNQSASAATANGLFDRTLGGSGLWTPTTAPTDLTRLNRIRSLVFGVP
jgi:hypothetical protein